METMNPNNVETIEEERGGEGGMAASLQGLSISPQQRRLWRLCPRAPFHPYRSACVVEIAGDLDLAALRAALERAAGRHEILRTSFHTLPGMVEPVQVIGEELPAPALLAPSGEESLDELLAGWESTAPADAASGPLRAAVAPLGPQRHALLLALPALCADGSSLDNLVREIAAAYGGQELEAPFQYADVAAWNNEILGLEEAGEGKSFWRRAGLSAGVDVSLPFPSAGSLGADFSPRTVLLALPAAVSDNVLLAVWQLLLARVTGRPDLVLGVVRSGRKYAEMMEALGPYARLLPLRCETGEVTTVAALGERTGAALGELEDWQEYFDWDLAMEGAAGGAERLPAPPAITAAFEAAVLPLPIPAGGATFTMVRRSAWSDRFTVMLRAERRGETVTAGLAYDASAVSRGDAERLGRWYETLLASALAAPESPAAELEILGGAERRRALVEWNATRADFGPATTLWEVAAEQAAHDPRDTAVE
jgi:Condensation domain